MGSAGNDFLFGADNISTADGAVDTIMAEMEDTLYFDESDASSLTVTNLDGGAGADIAYAVTNAGAVKVNAPSPIWKQCSRRLVMMSSQLRIRLWRSTCGKGETTR